MKELSKYKYAIVSKDNVLKSRTHNRKAIYKTKEQAERNMSPYEMDTECKIIKLYFEEL